MLNQAVRGSSSFRLIFFFICLFFSSCESRKTIVNGIDEREANEIVVFLAGKNIEASKVQAKAEGPGGGGGPIMYDITVDAAKVSDAMALLNANGLPRRKTQRLLELFTQGGLVPSEMQDKIRFQAGLAEQIASTIRKIDGILDADVQLSFPEEDPLNPGQPKGAVTASVFVKHQGVLDDPNSHLLTKIRRLVASSVQGLKFENVTVIADKGRFGDTAIQRAKAGQNNVELVRIWTVVVAQESVGRFQMIFLTLSGLTLIFFFGFVWMLWKILPVATQRGGLSQLFTLHPLEAESKPEVDKENVQEIQEAKEEAKGPKVQENVES